MEPKLEVIQRWLQAVITHPAGVTAGIECDEARQQIDIGNGAIDNVILPSRQQTSLERLAVYGNAYYLRLLDCLREFFPCLVDALGRETFNQFAVAYLQRQPPDSYTLERLADRFAAFLEGTRPEQDAAWAGFVVDLARLELAIEQVFHAAGPEPDPWPDASRFEREDNVPLSDLPSSALTAETRLLPTPGLTLLACSWPVNTYYTGWKRGQHLPWPEPQPQYVALLRRDYVVRRHQLPQGMYEILSGLVQGMTVGQAIAQAALSDADAELKPAELREWFFQWTRDGLFAGVATT